MRNTTESCHALGTRKCENYAMPNPKKIRAWCENDCGRRINTWSYRFCSNKCQISFQRKASLAHFKAGNLVTPYKLPSVVRDYLIRKYREACARCGWAERNPVTRRVPLEIEHIDGDWRNSTEANLTVLCPNCHSLTPTFRGLNKGRGRPGRPGLSATAHVMASAESNRKPTVGFEPTRTRLQIGGSGQAELRRRQLTLLEFRAAVEEAPGPCSR